MKPKQFKRFGQKPDGGIVITSDCIPSCKLSLNVSSMSSQEQFVKPKLQLLDKNKPKWSENKTKPQKMQQIRV